MKVHCFKSISSFLQAPIFSFIGSNISLPPSIFFHLLFFVLKLLSCCSWISIWTLIAFCLTSRVRMPKIRANLPISETLAKILLVVNICMTFFFFQYNLKGFMITQILVFFNLLERFDIKIWGLKCIVSILLICRAQVGKLWQSLHFWADST